MEIFKKLLFLTLLSGFFVSCSNEDEYADGTGFLSFGYLGVDTEIISMSPQSRMVEEGETENPGGGEAEDEDPLLPYIKDGFKVMVHKDESLVYECNSYDDYTSGMLENVELRAGSYNVCTFLGDVSLEGFEVNPCYGDTIYDVMVNRGKNSTVTFECSVINSLLKVEYTDNFKKYFSKYSVNVSSSLGNNIEYAMDETRSAYLSPGTVKVNVTARKEGGQEATFVVGDYDLLSRYEYELTLDVDAASSKMLVTFYDDVDNAEPVTIDVSDEAFNAVVPRIVASEGFESGKVVECIEGTLLSRIHSLSLKAEGMIGKCELTTTSEYLKSKGWPSEGTLDMVSMTPEQEQMLKDLGLKYKGLGADAQQMAYLDFTNFISNMPGGEHVEVNVNVTDRFGRSAEEPFVVSTNNVLCQFNVSATDEEVKFLGNECKVDLSFIDGVPENVKFYYQETGEELSVTNKEETVTADGVKHYIITLKGSDELKFINPFKLRVEYLSYKETEDYKVSYGVLIDEEGDVWAKRAVLHVYNDDMSNLKVQRNDDGQWIDVENLEISGSDLVVKGLDPDKKYQLQVVKTGKEPTNSVEFNTEKALQVPNAGFEDYYSVELYSQSVLWASNKIYGFYFWKNNSVDSDKWWDTTNTLTTPDPGGNSVWDYRSASGVVPTGVVSETASNFLRERNIQSDLKTEGHSGNAVEIATVGWGAGDKWTSASSQPSKRTAGQLYIGSYGNPIKYGKSFSSRPASIRFWYKYYSYNNETTAPYAEFYDKDNNRIGYGKFEIKNSANEFTQAEIKIEYTILKKAETFVLVFPSTDSANPGTRAVQGDAGAFSGYLNSRHIGSILTVDEIELIYE